MARKKEILVSVATFIMGFGVTYMTGSVPVFANVEQTPRISPKQAEHIAASMFPILDKYALQNEFYNSNGYGSPASYQLSYQMAGAANNGQYINVTVDANTGVILNFNQPSADSRFIFPIPLSAGKARQIAESWARKLYPTQFPDVLGLPLSQTFGPLQGPTQYVFQYERLVGGIPAPFDGFSITVDQNGDLVSAQDNWTDQKFPSAQGMISKAEADSVYRDALQLYLEYQSVYHTDGQPTTDLIYQSPDQAYPNWWGTNYSNNATPEFPVISAVNGRIIDASGDVYQPAPYTPPTPLVPGGPTPPLRPTPVNWTEQQALDYAKQLLDIGPADTLQSVNESKSQGADTNWSFSWQTPDQTAIYANVDTTYGTLVNFNENLRRPPSAAASTSTAPALTQAQIDATVDAFVKKVLPNATGGIAVVANLVTPKAASTSLQTDFQIVWLTNGIPDQTHSGDVSVDAQIGKIQYMYISAQPDNGSYPAVSKAMTEKQAVQMWIAARPLTLEYLETQPQLATKLQVVRGKKPTATQQEAKIELVYAPVANQSSTGQFNAITGQFETYGTQVPFTGAIEDLRGVAAAPQLQLLVDRGLLSVDNRGDVHPLQALTRSAFVKLLVDALGEQGRFDPQVMASASAKSALAQVSTSSPDYQAIGAAYSLGWLPADAPFAPGKLTTRDYAAQVLARALNFQPLLPHPDAILLKASDASSISSTHKAADALAVILDLIPMQKGEFNPGASLDLADAAVAVVQVAVIQGQQEPQFPAPYNRVNG